MLICLIITSVPSFAFAQKNEDVNTIDTSASSNVISSEISVLQGEKIEDGYRCRGWAYAVTPLTDYSDETIDYFKRSSSK